MMINVVLVGLEAPVSHAGTVVLAQQPGNGDNGGQGEDFGKSSPVGLLVLILFLIAVALLVKSMTKHLKRVPESFDDVEPGDGSGGTGDKGRPADSAEPEGVDSSADPSEDSGEDSARGDR